MGYFIQDSSDYWRQNYLMEIHRIEQKLILLNQYRQELEYLKPFSIEKWNESLKERLAIERQLHKIIECVLDLSFLLIGYFDLQLPENESDVFDILNAHIRNSEKLKRMKGFRNILVHQYNKIDYQIVLSILENNIRDFDDFIEDVSNIIKTGKSVE